MGSLFKFKAAGQASNGLVKDIDSIKGIITGYGASFNTVDSDNQVFMPGCFKKSLTENKARLKFLYQHCTTMPLSTFSSIEEDSTGLLFTTLPISQTSYGKDAIQLYEDGVFKEHSVGFEILATEQVTIDGDEVEGITEARLWEVSPVTWGANQNTPVVGLKGQFETEKDYIIDRIKLFQKALHRGTLRDDTYLLLEIELKQLEAILSLEPQKSTPAEKMDFGNILKELQTTQQLFKNGY